MRSFYNNKSILTALLFCFTTMVVAQDSPVGWATFGPGVTGGAGGDTVIVTNRAELNTAVNDNDPRVVMFQDTIKLTEYERMDVYSNKTILGMGQNAVIWLGGFEIKGDNVIVQNMKIGGSYDGDWSGETHSTDALTLYGENIWIDHCDLFASADGLLDIRADNGNAANFITVSNTRFSNHNKVTLIGASNEEIVDRGKLKTTIMNCWYDGTIERGLHQRMPRTRFGDIHILNNYYEDIASYCNAARFESDLVVEANYYRTSNDPHFREDVGLGIEDPELRAFDNIYELSSGRTESVGDAFEPSTFYDYTPLPAEQVPAYVLNNAGIFNPPGNVGPLAVTDTLYPEGSGLKIIDVTANDIDPDGGQLLVARSMYNAPTPSFVRDNMVLYAVPPQHPDVDTVFYELVDGQGGIDTGMVLVIYETSSVDHVIGKADVFEVNPNPVNQMASVNIEGIDADVHEADVQVVNIHGIPMSDVLTQPSVGVYNRQARFDIRTAHLAPGIYTLVLRADNRVYSKKFVVVH